MYRSLRGAGSGRRRDEAGRMRMKWVGRYRSSSIHSFAITEPIARGCFVRSPRASARILRGIAKGNFGWFRECRREKTEFQWVIGTDESLSDLWWKCRWGVSVSAALTSSF
uniref:Uncharacterized protein n=1 Tax=Syphacia muris TaxID=451379 RepID=A0A0N5ATS7_9BILA